MHISITKKSITTLLAEAGAGGAMIYDAAAGAMRYVVDGELLTPGQAAERFLAPCTACGAVWPRCLHI